MIEAEYAVSLLKFRADLFMGRRVALFGTSGISEYIIRECPEIRIIGVIDEDYSGFFFHGKPILSKNDVVKLRIDTVVLALHLDSVYTIYDRNIEFFSTHNIAIYDMYGRDMGAYEHIILESNELFLEQSLIDAKKAIDEHSCVGMNFEDVIAIADESEELYVFSRRDNTSSNLQKDNWKEHISPRKSVLDLINYALSVDKKLFVLSECGLPSDFIASIMKEWGVADGFSVYTAMDTGFYKMSGLFREVKEIVEESSVLFFGSDVCYDGVVASAYGFDYFPIKKASELFLMSFESSGIEKNTLEQKAYSRILCEIYNDPFCLFDTNGVLPFETVERIHEILLIQLIDNNIEHCKYEYKPVLIRDIFDPVQDHLIFEYHNHPTVSIIIPVYNQFNYTFKCLKSIQQHTKDVAYEIILADDCSNDRTKEIEKYVEGIKVLHNRTNLRFLRNCNNAIGSVAGKYVLFLNNDTQVQPNWLYPLVELMERDKTVGMTGSKLVYPDGSLQEAGGIVWKDGSAWNYGRNDDPLDAKYDYLREVDYISGASIMIRKDLLLKLDGFDDEFAPAYYEDTDLAFRVREAGYKVMYQPLSVVVHFEGKSNGTDESTGLKAYQVVNSKKFYKRWKEVLKRDHFPNGQDVFLAKDRSRNKKHILVIDHYIPKYDVDAGGRCTYMYLKQFVKMGLQVTFIGDNFAHDEPYRTELTNMGIEVLYGDWYYLNWKDWLAENGKYFDYCYPQRPHITIKWIDELKEKCPYAKIIYFTHDLHHLRAFREYKLTGDEAHLEESKKWKDIEFKIFDAADVIHVVGSYEQNYLQKQLPDKPVRNIPLYIYDKVPRATSIEKSFDKRQDVLFVGGFGHPPNEDAVLWFAEKVYPTILEKYPDMVWHIVGNKPTEAVRALESKNIIVHGRISDDELAEFYHKCRIAVVPLRYGAGVKGKIVEAAYYQIPMITTSIGAEGLSTAEGTMIVEDTAEGLAKVICDIYEDFDELRKMSDAGPVFIKRYFSQKAVDDVLKLDIR